MRPGLRPVKIGIAFGHVGGADRQEAELGAGASDLRGHLGLAARRACEVRRKIDHGYRSHSHALLSMRNTAPAPHAGLEAAAIEGNGFAASNAATRVPRRMRKD
jgi:hypothetical protein